MLAVSLSATAVLVGELRRRGWEADLASKRWRPLLRATLIAGTILLLCSVVANLLGNVALARLLASGTLYSGALLLLLSGVLQVLQGLWVIVLRSPRVSRRPLVADNVELFQKRGTRYLSWAIGLLWLFATARLFRVDAPIWDAVQRAVSWRARMGSLDLSLGDVLAFVVTLWIAVLLGRLVGFVLSEGLKTRGLGRGVHTAISRTATYAVVAAGLVIAVLASGTELTRLTVLIGTLGVGIGFGLQDVVNNFVLRTDPPLRAPGAGGGRHRGGGGDGNRAADRDPLEHGGHRAGLRGGGPQRAPHLQRGDQLDALRQAAPDRHRRRRCRGDLVRARPGAAAPGRRGASRGAEGSRAAGALRRLREQCAGIFSSRSGRRRRSAIGWRASCAPPSAGCWARPAFPSPRTRCTWSRSIRPCQCCSVVRERRNGARPQARRSDPVPCPTFPGVRSSSNCETRGRRLQRRLRR